MTTITSFGTDPIALKMQYLAYITSEKCKFRSQVRFTFSGAHHLIFEDAAGGYDARPSHDTTQ